MSTESIQKDLVMECKEQCLVLLFLNMFPLSLGTAGSNPLRIAPFFLFLTFTENFW